MSRTTLFCGRSDRLIARLKMMLYAWRFIDQVDGQLAVIWPSLPGRYAEEDRDYSPCLIFDLFRFYAAGGAAKLVFLETNQSAPADAVALDSPQFAEEVKTGFERALFEQGGIFTQKGSPQLRFKDEPADPAYLLSGVKDLFKSLPVHPHVTDGIHTFYERRGLQPGSFDTIHVRRGDVYDMLRTELPGWSGGALTSARMDIIINHFVARTAPLQFYAEANEAAFARGRKIVFTSDSPEAIGDFQRAFGRDKFIDLSSLRLRTPIQKAFADFLVLSDSAHIIGTSSNFSVMPAELAGVPFVNVAGTGSLDIAEATFHREFLQTTDDATSLEALTRLRRFYSDFAIRREASVRARAAALSRADRQEDIATA